MYSVDGCERSLSAWRRERLGPTMLPRRFVPTARLCVPGGSFHIRLCVDAIGSSDNGEGKSNYQGWSGTGPYTHTLDRQGPCPDWRIPIVTIRRMSFHILINQSLLLHRTIPVPIISYVYPTTHTAAHDAILILPSTLSICLGTSCQVQNARQYPYNLHEAVCGPLARLQS